MSRVKYNHSFGERRPLFSPSDSSSSSDSSSNNSSSNDSRSDNVFFRTWNNFIHSVRGAQPPLRPNQHSTRVRSPEPTYAAFIPRNLYEHHANSDDSSSISSWDVDLILHGSQYEPALESQTARSECQDEEQPQQPQAVGKATQYQLPTQIPATLKMKSCKIYGFLSLVLLVCFLYLCVKVVQQEVECPYGTTGDEDVCGKGVHFCCIGSAGEIDSSGAAVTAGESLWARRWTA